LLLQIRFVFLGPLSFFQIVLRKDLIWRKVASWETKRDLAATGRKIKTTEGG
jgi:hypothetical protein